MKKIIFLFLFSLLIQITNSQTVNSNLPLPRTKMNALLKGQNKHALSVPATMPKKSDNGSAYQAILKTDEVKKINFGKLAHAAMTGGTRSSDTVYVGIVPHDTLVITGTYIHTGPILVFNDGVLIFNNADVTNYGDVYAFQQGRILGISSNLTFPQDYFYQRSLIVVQNGVAYFNNCNFNYSGMQHNLVIGNTGQVGMENVHEADWTTAGIYGSGSLMIHGMNLGGEYILSDTSTCYFSNVDTLLLWHKIPESGVLNYSFPNGDTVMNYEFDNTVTGVSGVDYHVYADSCHNVWWAMMPVNGSDVTISDSDIRAIGCWFQHGDSAVVTGIYDNSTYADSVLPFSDRNTHMINTDVKTWNLYAFDSSMISISNSAVGEVGTQQKASVDSHDFLLDGSGGYFWATDTSAIFASNVTVYSTTRSERNGTFILANSFLPFSVPTSIHKSIFVSVQNRLPADPLPYDGSVMWMENIESPDTAHTDSLITIKGSAWIDQGPLGNPMDFVSYSLYYQLEGHEDWTAIVVDSATEIRHLALGTWNTNGLTAGNYTLRLMVRDNMTDTVEDFASVVLLPSETTGLIVYDNTLSVSVSPNPASDHLTLNSSEELTNAIVTIYNPKGQLEKTTSVQGKKITIGISELVPGAHIIEIKSGNNECRLRFVKL